MYTPKQFIESDPKTLLDFMRCYSFAALCSTHEGKPFATHIPFLVRERADQFILVGHMARANPQWKSFLTQEVLTIFTGPHCYISPAWYHLPGGDSLKMGEESGSARTPPEQASGSGLSARDNGEQDAASDSVSLSSDARPSFVRHHHHVPTWNYTAVHAYGAPTLVEGDEAVHAILRELVDHFESQEENPWRMELPDEYRLNLQAAIVAFEIVVTRIEGKFKLNQNRKPEERGGVIQALSQKTSENEQGVYQLMRALK